jgi:hypothetical protein
MPTEIAATKSRSGFPATRPCLRNPSTASASATMAPVIEAQRVPPSACSTSQSIVTWRSPSTASVGHGAKAPADQPLDLLRAARLLARGRLARAARVRRARQHAVFRGHPAASLALEERRHLLLDARGAQDLGVAHLDQHRALGVARVLAVDANGPQLPGSADRTSVYRQRGTFLMALWISAMARSISSSVTSSDGTPVPSCCGCWSRSRTPLAERLRVGDARVVLALPGHRHDRDVVGFARGAAVRLR